MPRSYSRELAERFQGNRRYFCTWNRFERWKFRLCQLAIIGVVVWGAFLLFGGSRGDAHVSHGPVANVHAAWDQQCDTCHKPQGLGDGRLLDAHARWHDLTCEKCHAGPLHHNNLKEEFRNETCSNCHHDHNGRNFSLTKISDDHCTRCHAELKPYLKNDTVPVAAVTNFATQHPDFKSLEDHQRHLKFSHAQHMTPGMPLTVNQKEPFTFKKAKELGMTGVERYRTSAQKSETDLVSMNCQSCHTPTGDGKTFQPITYEQHCAACHPTAVTNAVPSRGVIPSFNVPHGKQPDAYDAILKAEYSRLLQKDHPALAKLPNSTASDTAMKAFTEDVNATATKAKQVLLNTNCKLCHDGLPEKVTPPNIPTIWLKSANFDHMAHRSADCKSCHNLESDKRVGDPGFEIVPPGYKAPKVDIAGIDNCRKCHAPQQVINGVPSGGIRFGCTDCHGYHQVDRLHQRQTDTIYFPKPPLSIEGFLRGKGRE